jgi:lysophospholipase L1-like esterase
MPTKLQRVVSWLTNTGRTSASQARNDLGLGSAATLAAGTVGAAVMAADTGSEGRTALGLGTAAVANTGTSAGNVVVLDGSARLPAVDGRNLTNLPASGGIARVVNANTTAANDERLNVVASATITDPVSPVEGKGYSVAVVNGTATVGGTGYSVAGTIIERVYHSGSWRTEVYLDSTQAIPASEKGAANGVAPLVGGLVPAENLPVTPDANPLNSLATHRYLRRTGADFASGGLTTVSTIFLLSPRRLPPGRVVNVRLHNGSTGNFRLCLVRPNGSGGVTIVERSADIAGTSGTQTLVAGVDFPQWILDGALQIGVQCQSGAPGLRYDNSIGEGYQFLASTVTLSNTAGGTVFYTVDVAVEEPRRGGATLEWDDFGSLPVGWTNGGSAWAFSPTTRAATSSTAGLTNQLRTGLRYGLDKRTIRWEFTLGSLSSIAAFLTNPVEGGIQSGSLVYVSAADQQIQIYGRYTGANAPTLITSAACTLAANTRYVFEWTKSGRSFTAAVKTLGGTTVATITRTATPWGYSTYPAYGYDQGTMQGAPGVAVIAGSVSVFSFDHRAACMVSPNLYILGDSITEGFSVTDAQKWPALVEASLGSARVAYSGIGGANTAGSLARLAAEISSLRPRNVLIYLGTNPDGSFAANIVTLAYAAQQLGANVYVATVPTSSTNTTAINALAPWIRKVAFDLALTSGGAGTSLITASYTNTDANGNNATDSVHPNSAGHLAMFTRIGVDAPELLVASD